MNGEVTLPLDGQREIIRHIIGLAARLEEQGDPYLRAQYMHLKERAEALHSVLETGEDALLPG